MRLVSRVRWATGDSKVQHEKIPASAQVHFSYISKPIPFPIDEKVIYNIFSRFGEIGEVSFRKASTHPISGVQSGYGFIHFPLTHEGISSALHVSETVKQLHVDGIVFDCCLSHGLRHFLKMDPCRTAQLNSPTTVPFPASVPSSMYGSADIYDCFPGVTHLDPHSLSSFRDLPTSHTTYSVSYTLSEERFPSRGGLPQRLVHSKSDLNAENENFFKLF
jgi:hypothetical protein